MMKKRSRFALKPVLFALFPAILLMSFPVQAHFPWINLVDYTPSQGAGLNLTIGYGHHYPLDGFLKKDALQSISLIGPDKEAPAIKFTSELELQSEEALSQEGVYIVAAQQKDSYYTKTANGAKRTSKKGLDGVIRCSYSHKCMKAVATVGKGGRADTVVGHPIEIIPLENPANLKAGDYLPIRVIADGKPFSGDVFATFSGFSTEKSTFAYATRTDKKGHARIRILQPGVWLIKVSHEVPFADSTECDLEKFVGTLTFAVE